MKVSVYRKARFNAAHRLHNPEWTEEKNNRIFGKCNSPNFHGHNYTLEVKVTGPVNKETGFVVELGELKKLIAEEVTGYLDHRNLNLDIPEFKNLNPTAENIAIIIWNRLQKKIEKDLNLQVRLYETERNFVKYPA